MKIKHNKATLQWQKKMRSFIDEYLIPWEIEAEMNNGVIPDDASMKMQAKAIEM